MTTFPSYGYAAVESPVLAFVQASYLIPKDHPAYTDMRQLAEGKRRFYSSLKRGFDGKKSNAKDLPALANLMKAKLAKEWATPEMADEVARRLAKYISLICRISCAQFPRPTFRPFEFKKCCARRFLHKKLQSTSAGWNRNGV